MQEQKHSSELNIKWFATLNDGNKIIESDNIVWSNIANKVVELSWISDSQTLISLPLGMKRYMQGKTGSCSLMGGKISIESRWIGFYAPSGDKIITRVDETTGKVSIEVEKDDPISNDKKL